MHHTIRSRGRSVAALLVIVALFGFGQSRVASAAMVWGSATNISADTNVSTSGTLKEAINDGGSTTSVNGVSFTALATNGTAGPFNSPGGFFSLTTSLDSIADFTGFGSPNAPFTNLTSAYQSILGTGSFSGSQPISVTLKSLVASHVYQFQVWINDSRNAFAGGVVVSDGAANVTLDKDVGDTDGGTGQFAIGTFTATATTEAISIDGQGNGTLVSAMQLREVPEPSTALAGAMLVPALLSRRRRV